MKSDLTALKREPITKRKNRLIVTPKNLRLQKKLAKKKADLLEEIEHLHREIRDRDETISRLQRKVEELEKSSNRQVPIKSPSGTEKRGPPTSTSTTNVRSIPPQSDDNAVKSEYTKWDPSSDIKTSLKDRLSSLTNESERSSNTTTSRTVTSGEVNTSLRDRKSMFVNETERAALTQLSNSKAADEIKSSLEERKMLLKEGSTGNVSTSHSAQKEVATPLSDRKNMFSAEVEKSNTTGTSRPVQIQRGTGAEPEDKSVKEKMNIFHTKQTGTAETAASSSSARKPEVKSSVKDKLKAFMGIGGKKEDGSDTPAATSEPAAAPSAASEPSNGHHEEADHNNAAHASRPPPKTAAKPKKFGTWGASKMRKAAGEIGAEDEGEAASQEDACEICRKTVYITEKLVADKRTFHKGCFRCSTCNSVLKLGNYASMDGEFFCKPCFKKNFLSKGNYSEGFGKLKPQAEFDQKTGKASDPVFL